MNYQSLLISAAVVVMAMLVSNSEAIDCLTCLTCDEEKLPDKKPCDVGDACFKSVVAGVTSRGCTLKGQAKDFDGNTVEAGKCVEKDDNKYCLCDSDACNGAGNVSYSLALMILAAVASKFF